MNKMHYGRLLAMVVLSFIAMYILMYAMVDSLANVYPNFNQFYMAGLMAAPMLIIELLLMGSMYPNKKLNTVLILAGMLALGLFWMLIRQQTAINDTQFLKSMIPPPRRGLADVRKGTDPRCGNSGFVSYHYCQSAGRNRPDENPVEQSG